MPEYDSVESETRLGNVINSVSAYIDSYLSEGGFATPGPIFATTDTEARTRLEELLSDICIAIVAGRVLPVATSQQGRREERKLGASLAGSESPRGAELASLVSPSESGAASVLSATTNPPSPPLSSTSIA